MYVTERVFLWVTRLQPDLKYNNVIESAQKVELINVPHRPHKLPPEHPDTLSPKELKGTNEYQPER